MGINTTLALITAFLAISLIVVVATLNGIDTGIVTGGIGAIVALLSAALGIKGGEVRKERQVRRFLEGVSKKEPGEDTEQS